MRWIDELESRAEAIVPGPAAEYFRQGAGPGISASEAVAAWEAVRLRPRILRDVSRVSLTTTVAGQPVASPFLIAPSTLQRLAHPDGESAVARAAKASGSLMCVSSNAGTAFRDIGAAGAPWWIQGYIMRDRELSARLLYAAREAGATAIVLTADTPVVGHKETSGDSVWDLVSDDQLLANIDAERLDSGTLDKAADLTFADIAWLRDAVGLPVIVKGVLRGDDARACADAGAAAVIVSNHGGRQLDQAIPTARALPEVVAALDGTGVEVYVDGGVRRGVHALAALAMGARAVLLGRPVLWALAVNGESGVRRLLGDLDEELGHAMTLAGTVSIADIGADLVAG